MINVTSCVQSVLHLQPHTLEVSFATLQLLYQLCAFLGNTASDIIFIQIDQHLKKLLQKYKEWITVYRCSITATSVTAAVVEIMGPKHIGAITFTFQSSGHVTIRFTIGHCLSMVILTEHLSPTVFEILNPKHIGVTTLTFGDHVTSSVMRPFDLL